MPVGLGLGGGQGSPWQSAGECVWVVLAGVWRWVDGGGRWAELGGSCGKEALSSELPCRMRMADGRWWSSQDASCTLGPRREGERGGGTAASGELRLCRVGVRTAGESVE